jgi:hypothetical protein
VPGVMDGQGGGVVAEGGQKRGELRRPVVGVVVSLEAGQVSPGPPGWTPASRISRGLTRARSACCLSTFRKWLAAASMPHGPADCEGALGVPTCVLALLGCRIW